MKMKMTFFGMFLALCFTTASAQSISSETIEFQFMQQPKEIIDAGLRTYKVTVTSPYNLTADDVIKQSKEDHRYALSNY